MSGRGATPFTLLECGAHFYARGTRSSHPG